MREEASVVAVDGSVVWVETHRQSACGACSASGACGQGLMSKLLPGRTAYLRVLAGGEGAAPPAVGDRVTISVPDDALLRVSAFVYLLPLLLMLGGILVGAALVAGDAGALMGGVAGLLAGAAALSWHARKSRFDRRIQPRIVGRSLPAQASGANSAIAIDCS